MRALTTPFPSHAGKPRRIGSQDPAHKDRVYARLIPGYTPKASEVPGAVHYAIGPDKQLDAWEQYLKATEGPETKLYRLYARDYWMP
jgi:hypothetical protein